MLKSIDYDISSNSLQTVLTRRTWSYLLPAETPITHPELSNREMWIDFFSQNPITKVYHLYKQLDSAGIHPDELDVVQLPNTLNDEHF